MISNGKSVTSPCLSFMSGEMFLLGNESLVKPACVGNNFWKSQPQRQSFSLPVAFTFCWSHPTGGAGMNRAGSDPCLHIGIYDNWQLLVAGSDCWSSPAPEHPLLGWSPCWDLREDQGIMLSPWGYGDSVEAPQCSTDPCHELLWARLLSQPWALQT